MSKPHSCKRCGGVEPDVKFRIRESGNKGGICEGCRSLTNLSRLYGVSYEQYQAMVVAQGGCCAVCGVSSWDQTHKSFKRLVVDHDHNTGQVRGLLCAKCNFGLGQFNDDTSLLNNAINYLKG